jgi:polyphosphate kinase
MADPATNTKYLNRELSWLEFNQRVLAEAQDASVPLLERLKFLAITASNLDEFFMVRVGSLQMLLAQGITKSDPAGMTPEQQLQATGTRTHQMTVEQYTCFLEDLEPKLSDAGLRRRSAAELAPRQAKLVEQLFDNELSSILTPIAVTSSEDFPLLATQSLNVCVRLDPAVGDEPKTPRFAIIPFGKLTSRFVSLPADGGYEFMLLEDVIAQYVQRFFDGEKVNECVPFRITRNADFSVREDQAPDLLAEMEEVLEARRTAACVRLEVSDRVTTQLLAFLQDALKVSDDSVYVLPGPLDLSAYMQLGDRSGFDHLRYESWPPQPSPSVDLGSSMFQVLQRQDLLLVHPYESFEPVLRLLEEAADDPQVLAIKQTLYRTSRNSPIIAALQRAAEKGKYVTAIVELKARFDEARNIEWAKGLELAGAQVIYGVKGLKTHAKCLVIVRREPQGIVRYVHFGTGNYNESTARLYSDVSFLSSNEELGADATSFFNAVTGYSQPMKFRKLDMAPLGLRPKLLEMIEAETQRKKHGQKAVILAKLNSLVCPKIIDALYEASQAGVKIRLNIRGICCLRPGVKGLSENISVVSIVDRFLEHSRVLYFYHGGDERVFISSADWMPRNLERRVELLVPIEDRALRTRLISVLETYFDDNVKARRLNPDGSYSRVKQGKSAPQRAQEVLFRETCEIGRLAENSRRTVFEPHRATGEP